MLRSVGAGEFVHSAMFCAELTDEGVDILLAVVAAYDLDFASVLKLPAAADLQRMV